MAPQSLHRAGRPQPIERRSPFFAHWMWFLVLPVAYVLTSPVQAADSGHSRVVHLTGTNQSIDGDLVLACPQSGSAEPQFENQKTGKMFPISDPRLRAVATKACTQGLGGSLGAEQGSVNIVNQTGAAIWVGFSGSLSRGVRAAKPPALGQ